MSETRDAEVTPKEIRRALSYIDSIRLHPAADGREPGNGLGGDDQQPN